MSWRSRLPVFLAALFFIAVIVMIALSPEKDGIGESYVICLGSGVPADTNASWETAPDVIRPFEVQDGLDYAFVLPESWDTSCLNIFFSGVRSVRIGDNDYQSGDSISLEIEKQYSVKPKGKKTISVTLYKTGGLPVIFIRTASGTSETIHSTKHVTEPGVLFMVAADGRVLYRESLSSVRLRGNATMSYNKKPYQIKLEEPEALIEGRKNKTWILLANALDRSQIRNTLALDMARYSGLFVYTPRTQPVDLYMNNDYKGTYLLTEKVQAGENNLPIFDLEKAVETMNPDIDLASLEVQGDLEYKAGAKKYREIPEEPDDLTGGYILIVAKPNRFEREASVFVTERGCMFLSQEPKYLSKAQVFYIAEVFQRIEDALFSPDGIDPATGQHYTELLDLASFAGRYLIAEVLDDFDWKYCYFYKNSDAVDSKVYAGPVWDQDNILGVWGPDIDPETVNVLCDDNEDWLWFPQAAKHADFRTAVKDSYYDVFRPAVQILLGLETDPDGILRSIDEYASEVRRSAQMDYLRWKDPLGIPDEPYNTSTGETFEEQMIWIKDYLATRRDALDGHF